VYAFTVVVCRVALVAGVEVAEVVVGAVTAGEGVGVGVEG
jgi:hypothetical protein